MTCFKLNTTAANIRTGGSSSFPDKGDLVREDVVQGTGPAVNGWQPYKMAQHANGDWVKLADGKLLDENNTITYWSTNAYFQEVPALPKPPTEPPPPDPDEDPLPEFEVAVTIKDTDGLYVPVTLTAVMKPK